MYSKTYTIMKNKKGIMINIRINNSLKDRFKKHCDKNGFSLSKRLRILMESDIKTK